MVLIQNLERGQPGGISLEVFSHWQELLHSLPRPNIKIFGNFLKEKEGKNCHFGVSKELRIIQLHHK